MKFVDSSLINEFDFEWFHVVSKRFPLTKSVCSPLYDMPYIVIDSSWFLSLFIKLERTDSNGKLLDCFIQLKIIGMVLFFSTPAIVLQYEKRYACLRFNCSRVQINPMENTLSFGKKSFLISIIKYDDDETGSYLKKKDTSTTINLYCLLVN